MKCQKCGAETNGTHCDQCGAAIEKTELNNKEKTHMLNNMLNKLRLTKKTKKWFSIGGSIVAAAIVIVTLFATMDTSGKQNIIAFVQDGELKVATIPNLKAYSLADSYYTSGTPTYLISDDGKYIYYADDVEGDSFSLYCQELGTDKPSVKIESNLEGNFLNVVQINSDGTNVFFYKNENLYMYDGKERSKIASDISGAYSGMPWIVDAKGEHMIYQDSEQTIYELAIGSEAEKISSSGEIQKIILDPLTVYYTSNDSLYCKQVEHETQKVISDLKNSSPFINQDGTIYYLKQTPIQMPLADIFEDDMVDETAAEPNINDYLTQKEVNLNEILTEDFWEYNQKYSGSSKEDYIDYYESYADNDYASFEDWFFDFEASAIRRYIEFSSSGATVGGYNTFFDSLDDDSVKEWLIGLTQSGYESVIGLWSENSGNGVKYHMATVDIAAYENALSNYSKISERAQLREQIANATYTYLNPQLCYFDGNTETILAENVFDAEVANQNGVLVYCTKAPITGQKIKMSELESYTCEEIYQKHQTNFAENTEGIATAVAVGKSTFPLVVSNGSRYAISTDGSNIYFMEEYNQEKETGRLIQVAVSKSGLGEPVVLCDNAYSYGVNIDGTMIYYTDVNEKGHGNFFENGTLVDEDVYLPLICNTGNDGFAYLVDFTTDDGGTLKISRNGKAEKLADNVHAFKSLGDKGLIYLQDYDTENGDGTLYYSDFRHAEIIEDDVEGFLPINENIDNNLNFYDLRQSYQSSSQIFDYMEIESFMEDGRYWIIDGSDTSLLNIDYFEGLGQNTAGNTEKVD